MNKLHKSDISRNTAFFKEFAYDKGAKAYLDGLSVSDNPYKKTMSDHLVWHGGWMEASKGFITK